MFLSNLASEKTYTVDDVKDICKLIPKTFVQKRKKKIYNIPCAFDIETSSFYDNDEKRACMYIWQFGIDGFVFIGRTWSEFILLCERLADYLQLQKYRLICYVHLLGYEFQFIRKLFIWDKVFCISSRSPAYARAKIGIEFRDSYILSGYSLEKTAEQIQCINIAKKVGDLNYDLIRNSATQLSEKELSYCIYDVKVVMAYIYDKIQQDGGINRIPMTKTGYVRQRIKRYFSDDKSAYWRVKESTLTPECYQSCVRAMMGGFVHANPKYVGKILNDAFSMDISSSYPYVILSEKYPIGSPELLQHLTKKEFSDSINYYCCIFDIELTDVSPKVFFDNYLSESRCMELENPITNNGRIAYAKRLTTTITNVDFKLIEKFYNWKTLRVRNFYRWKRTYLPKPIIKAVLDLYQIKTELKNVKGKEVEYLAGKQDINSVYGSFCTSVLMDVITYTDDYQIEIPDLNTTIDKYNKNYGRVMYYPWGVFVTAFARKNVLSAVFEFGKTDDYIYSDTDSIKGLHYSNHKAFIDKYNNICDKKLRRMCEYYDLDFSATRPKTIKGVEKPLGYFDFEGNLLKFKTIGAKRYAYQSEDGEYRFTVSGVRMGKYMASKYPDNPLDHFSNQLEIPAEYSGKKTHTYIDDITEGCVTDYQGHTVRYSEMSSIHIEPQPFSLKMSNQFLDFIEKVMMYERNVIHEAES